MFLSELYRYPVKSCQAQSLRASPVGLLGLQGDRRWMVVEAENGRFLTQRAWPRLGQIAAHDDGCGQLLLQAPGRSSLRVAVPPADGGLRGVTIWRDTLRVPDAGDGAAAWLSEWLGKAVRLVHCPEQRARYLPNGYGFNSDRAAFPDGFPLLLIGQSALLKGIHEGLFFSDSEILFCEEQFGITVNIRSLQSLMLVMGAVETPKRMQDLYTMKQNRQVACI